MPSIPVLIGLFILGVVVAFGFAFSAIGLVGEAAALLAAVGLSFAALDTPRGKSIASRLGTKAK